MSMRRRVPVTGLGRLVASLGLVSAVLGGVGGAAVPAAHALDLTASSSMPGVNFDDTNVSGSAEWIIRVNQANEFPPGGPMEFNIQDATTSAGIMSVVRLRSSDNNSDSLVVDENGDIVLVGFGAVIGRTPPRMGIGTLTPQGSLHLYGAANQDVFAGMGQDLAAGPAFNFGYAGSSFGEGAGFLNVRPDPFAVAPNPSLRFATSNVQRMIITSLGRVGIGVVNPGHPLQMASGARVTAAGIWTDASSRAYKQDIQPLAADAAHAALERLAPVTFTSRADPAERHVGFVAEDVPDLVATPDRRGLSPRDIVAVLTRVVQEQQRIVQEQRHVAQEQQRALAAEAAARAAQDAAIAALAAEVAALRRTVGP
jgi:hypothetical protein